MKFKNFFISLFISFLALAVSAEDAAKTNEAIDFCKDGHHTGTYKLETGNKFGSIGDIKYEIWNSNKNDNSGNAHFHEDGSFIWEMEKCSHCFCGSGISFNTTIPYQLNGHIYADFKLVKENIKDVAYSYVGVHGRSQEPFVEYYIIDSWITENRPGNWVAENNLGNIMVGGAEYTVYKNYFESTSSVNGQSTNYTQIFSVRKEPRDCGTIDVTTHFRKWREFGVRINKLHDAKVRVESSSENEGSGKVDLPYAKVYVKKFNPFNFDKSGLFNNKHDDLFKKFLSKVKENKPNN